MDTEFLVQMRQSNKCGSERNDEIFNLHLGSGAGPWISIPCLLQDTSHIYWFHPPEQLTRKKQRTQKSDYGNTFRAFFSHCRLLCSNHCLPPILLCFCFACRFISDQLLIPYFDPWNISYLHCFIFILLKCYVFRCKIFLFAAWLMHSQLWATVEGTSSITWC